MKSLLVKLAPLVLLSLVNGAAIFGSERVISLGPHSIEPNSLTVSGISAGGAFATQFHVAFSSQVVGVGIFAGLPNGCAKGSLSTALNCMSSPILTNVATLVTRTNNYASSGKVDPTSNMANDKVYIFHGTTDSVVAPGNAGKIKTYYDSFITAGSNYLIEDGLNSEHGFPTNNFGTACNRLNSASYINNCDYLGAYEMLNFFYGGNLKKPTGSEAVAANLFKFDQKDFFPTPASVSMAVEGFVYIPTQCQDPTRICKLHISFHGCKQGSYLIQDTYAMHAGYLEVAELNGIIVLFPQTVSQILNNPNGCFDWWGYVDNDYDTKTGTQMDGVMKMVHALTGTAA